MTHHITVFAASADGVHAEYLEAARALGRGIAERGWTLTWGGGRNGLMGAVSSAARAAGGEVRGVILDRFVHMGVQCEATLDMEVVADMRARKAGLDMKCDAIVALPGGLGTLDEVAEMLCFKQLGIHAKPIVLVDTRGYWGPLLATLEHAVEQGFVREGLSGAVVVAATPHEALAEIERAFDAAAGASGSR
jgi:uncharacterized protein (TIGR00730 family)